MAVVGWPEDARMEALRDAFSRSSSPEEQERIAEDIQKEIYDEVIYFPLGQYLALSAWRKSLAGVLDGPAFTSVLADHGVAISMDGKGAWRDNVFVERL